ncbi:MAG TPA: DinB family protein [Candidatus Dormibacteraeota bacterium]|nr:DinB family protein [Candidatus Dormibacteraeota bacterium]
MATLSRSLEESIARYYKVTHDRLLKSAEDTKAEEFAWSAGPSLHSVAWQLWHAARWDDLFGAYLHRAFGIEPLAQVWERNELNARWGWVAGSAGHRDSGTGMEDEAADHMRFPDKDEVVDYAREAFAFVRTAIEAVPADQMLGVAKDDKDGDTYIDNILIYFEHLNRHLGMIEAIRGLQGGKGSATR